MVLVLDGHFNNAIVPTNGIDNGHVFSLAKYGVNSVEVGLRRMADEELTSSGVFARVRHGEGACEVFVRINFAVDLVARTTGSGGSFFACTTVGAAALDHEVGNDPVKG